MEFRRAAKSRFPSEGWTLTLTDRAGGDDRYADCLAIDCFSFRESSTSHTLSSPAVRRHSLTLLVKKTLPFFPLTLVLHVLRSVYHTPFWTPSSLSLFLGNVWNLCYRFASSFTANNNNNICRNHSHKYSQTRRSVLFATECTSEKFANFSELIVNLPRKQNRLELLQERTALCGLKIDPRTTDESADGC